MKTVKETKNPKISKALKNRHKARVQEKLNTDPDYIYSKKFSNSLTAIIEKYPDGVPDTIIAKVLKIKPTQFNIVFDRILEKLKENLK